MRHIIPVVLAVILAGPSALAADQGRLAPGKPAGTREANINAPNLVMWTGLIGFAVGLSLILKNAHGSVQGASSTTATAG